MTVTPASAEPPPKQCRPRPDGKALSVFDAGECGAALVVDDRGLGLWSLSPDRGEQPARGPAPEPCDKTPCTYLGYDGVLGPVVLALVEGPTSEMPAGVWLGIALDTGGQQLVFFDLWAGAGDSVSGDSTDLGPAHSLAPFSCGGQLGLFATGRLAAAVGQQAPAALTAREGLYRWDTDAPKRAAVARDGCAPIPIELP